MFALGASGIKEILDSLVRQGCPSEKKHVNNRIFNYHQFEIWLSAHTEK